MGLLEGHSRLSARRYCRLVGASSSRTIAVLQCCRDTRGARGERAGERAELVINGEHVYTFGDPGKVGRCPLTSLSEG